ncbi:hypothetical protein EGH24_13845 [Halonotius terrestris]|uniref:Uncharacterized protein n=1 Tax=Halonotius terrestris TaxID=2487750 RepID=A0A8J8PAN1_9EURY|nr:hypothetical protein [Halonotius terrestris]TQQ78600.1 hypothetical protein EGH24_13845 [Halonotius terrestris]
MSPRSNTRFSNTGGGGGDSTDSTTDDGSDDTTTQTREERRREETVTDTSSTDTTATADTTDSGTADTGSGGAGGGGSVANTSVQTTRTTTATGNRMGNINRLFGGSPPTTDTDPTPEPADDRNGGGRTTARDTTTETNPTAQPARGRDFTPSAPEPADDRAGGGRTTAADTDAGIDPQPEPADDRAGGGRTTPTEPEPAEASTPTSSEQRQAEFADEVVGTVNQRVSQQRDTAAENADRVASDRQAARLNTQLSARREAAAEDAFREQLEREARRERDLEDATQFAGTASALDERRLEQDLEDTVAGASAADPGVGDVVASLESQPFVSIERGGTTSEFTRNALAGAIDSVYANPDQALVTQALEFGTGTDFDVTDRTGGIEVAGASVSGLSFVRNPFQQGPTLGVEFADSGQGTLNEDIAESLTAGRGLFASGTRTVALDDDFATPDANLNRLTETEIRERVAAANEGIEPSDVDVSKRQVGDVTDVEFSIDADAQDLRERVAAAEGVDPSAVAIRGDEAIITTDAEGTFFAPTEAELRNRAAQRQEFFGVGDEAEALVGDVEFAGIDFQEVAGGLGSVSGQLAAAPPQALLAADTATEIGANLPGTVEEFGAQATGETLVEGAGRGVDAFGAQIAENPERFAGQLAGEVAAGVAGGLALQRAPDAARSASVRARGGDVFGEGELADPPTRTEGSNLPGFTEAAQADPRAALREFREQAEGNPLGGDDATAFSVRARGDVAEFGEFGADFEVPEGASELPGQFFAADLSNLRLGDADSSLSPSIGLPNVNVGRARALAEQDVDLGIVPPGTRGEVADFLQERADRGRSFIRAGETGPTPEQEAIAPPGSRLREVTQRPLAEVRGALPSGDDTGIREVFPRPLADVNRIEGSTDTTVDEVFPRPLTQTQSLGEPTTGRRDVFGTPLAQDLGETPLSVRAAGALPSGDDTSIREVFPRSPAGEASVGGLLPSGDTTGRRDVFGTPLAADVDATPLSTRAAGLLPDASEPSTIRDVFPRALADANRIEGSSDTTIDEVFSRQLSGERAAGTFGVRVGGVDVPGTDRTLGGSIVPGRLTRRVDDAGERQVAGEIGDAEVRSRDDIAAETTRAIRETRRQRAREPDVPVTPTIGSGVATDSSGVSRSQRARSGTRPTSNPFTSSGVSSPFTSDSSTPSSPPGESGGPTPPGSSGGPRSTGPSRSPASSGGPGGRSGGIGSGSSGGVGGGSSGGGFFGGAGGGGGGNPFIPGTGFGSGGGGPQRPLAGTDRTDSDDEPEFDITPEGQRFANPVASGSEFLFGGGALDFGLGTSAGTNTQPSADTDAVFGDGGPFGDFLGGER